jgi:hypothetical protein
MWSDFSHFSALQASGSACGEAGALLRLAGWDEMQGFQFARPAPAKAIDKLLVQAKQGGRPLTAADEALTA